MFTPKKIISYVFFALALVAFITNCVVSGSDNRDWTKKFANEVTYSVEEVTAIDGGETVTERKAAIVARSNAEYTYAIANQYVPDKVNDDGDEVTGDKTFVIVSKTKVEQTKVKWTAVYSSVTYTNLDIKRLESYIDALENIRGKYVTDSEKNSISVNIETEENKIKIVKSIHSEEKRKDSIEDTQKFWQPSSMGLIPINTYWLMTLLFGITGAIFFLKKDETTEKEVTEVKKEKKSKEDKEVKEEKETK
ncbi:MAG: hypothetical protein LBQ05_02795 [Christensenellaceae bacterium]|nr:hypothetical protein [Christensenellaceae bacterium]